MNKILFYVVLAVFSSSVPNEDTNGMKDGVFICKMFAGSESKIESDMFK